MTVADHAPSAPRRQVHLIDLTSIPGMVYSATLGYLQAAAEADPEVGAACEFHRHVRLPRGEGFERACADVLAALDDPLAVSFTIYFWNRAKSLLMARRIKERWPDCRVVVGGNDVSYQQDELFAEAPWVDVLVHGDGELRFVDILRSLLHGRDDFCDIPGVSYWSGRGSARHVVTTEPAPRIADLAEVPSPVAVHSDRELAETSLVVYETNRGCPYGCAFCYWGGATNSKVRQFPLERIEQDLDRIIRLSGPQLSLGLADANFGILPRDVDIARLLVELCHRHGKNPDLIVTWAKNSNDRVLRTAKILHDGAILAPVTLSTQSFDPTVLDLANRSNIRLENYRRLQTGFRELGIATYTDLIWGMPGETYDSFTRGLEETLTAGGSPVVFPLLLLNNTDYTRERFREEQRLVVRRSPADVTDPEMVVEMVVGHSRMSEEDWLRGLELRLCVYLFQKAVLRCGLRVLHTAGNARLVDLCDRLRDFLFGWDGDDVVRRLARNYRESWRSPEKVDWELIDGQLGVESGDNGVYLRSEMHYEAILHRLTQDGVAARFLRDATGFLLDGLPDVDEDGRRLARETLDVDLAAVAVFRSLRSGESEKVPVRVPAAAVPLLRDNGDLPPDLASDEGDVVGVALTPPSLLANHHPQFSFSRYAMLVWRGLARPLHDLVFA
ncbi:radical SAM protein [Streptoalloteichus hindustanus]|uniref:Radical SAM superfamily protein n=1 Tax=Streptoalloteichus hindustanus TaxID=2017 RepID=A0A1M5P5H1_STRHI|nr:radical SAM protein [Streptoalloteichus hindustanus]SHG96965.1 Radical SAM superfamily protein [Streptoalloteichus hindustanus]